MHEFSLDTEALPQLRALGKEWDVRLHAAHCIPHARTEGDDRLAREIIAFEKGVDGHGQILVPDRIAEVDDVVLRHIIDL